MKLSLSLNTRILSWVATILVFAALMFAPMVAFGQTPRSDAPSAAFNCSVFSPSLMFQECFWKPLMSSAGSFFLTLGGTFLRFSGLIFDSLVNYVILDFGGTMNLFGITSIINASWTVFRDLANIMIIGIFVFIAISLILGVKEYGQKRLVARVLIVAVLINFSLLFAKIMIDASNYIAFDVYQSTAATACAGKTTTGPQGISDRFLCPLGITSIWDTRQITDSVARNKNGGAVMAFMFGLLGGIMLAGVAVVLLYGAFLIVSRTIVLILLMMIAPIAFASYLMPNLEGTPVVGWKGWWKALFNNAVFAPLLVIFLTISIFIVSKASTQTNISFGQVLGSFDQSMISGNAWRVLFLYLLSVGVLFASFRISSKLAGSISGYKIGHMMSGLPVVAGALAGSRLAQLTAGRAAAGQSLQKGAELQGARLQALRSGKVDDWARVESLRKEKAALDKKANSTFNPMNSFLGEKFAKGSGLAAVGITGKTKGGFTDDMHNKAVKAEDAVKGMQVTKEDKKAVENEAIDAAKEAARKNILDAETQAAEAKKKLDDAQKAKDAIENERAAADQEVDQRREGRKTDIETAEVEIKNATEKKSQLETAHTVNISAMMKEAEQLQGRARDQRVLEIQQAHAQHQSAIKREDSRIDEARKNLTKYEAEVQAPRAALEDRIAKAQKEIEERAREHNAAAARLADAQKKSTDQAIKSAAGAEVKKFEQAASANFEAGKERIAEETAGALGGHEGAHIIKHHFDEKFKQKSRSESVLEALKSLQKEDKKPE